MINERVSISKTEVSVKREHTEHVSFAYLAIYKGGEIWQCIGINPDIASKMVGELSRYLEEEAKKTP